MKTWRVPLVPLVTLIMASALIAGGCGDNEEKDWEEAVSTNRPEAVETFLKEHPQSEYSAQALELLDELDWQEAQAAGTSRAFVAYAAQHPDGAYAEQARVQIEELRWQTAQQAGTKAALDNYLQNHPDGKHVDQAVELLDELDWGEAQAAGTISSYQHYLDTYASGRFAAEAENRIASLARDDSVFLAAQAQDTRAAYEYFLAEYPGHRREADARRAVEEILGDVQGRPITDLIAQNKIQAESRGSGIESVSLEVRRLVQHEVTVLIPAGTFFVAQGSVQSMVTTAEREITLTGDGWGSVSLPAACANLHRDVPRDDDSFEIRASPQQVELGRVARLLAERDAGNDVTQAAVWIVADDADYRDLGTLVSAGRFGLGGSRVIDETDAAEAMRIVDEAGVDITRRAIWRDRSTIIRALPAGNLKSWLQQRAP